MTATKNLAAVLGTALLTALFAGTLLRVEGILAEEEVIVVEPVTSLLVDGVKITIELEKKEYAAGEEPVLVVCALNTEKRDASVQTKLRMTSRNVWVMSRAPVMPNEVWTKDISITLKPGETKTLLVKTESAVAPNTIVAFAAVAGEKSLQAGGFTVKAIEGQKDEEVALK